MLLPNQRNVVVIVQARMTSTRLPGKVMREVLGRPLLAYELERIARARTCSRFVVATTTNDVDDNIADFAKGCGWEVWRGPEHDVLERYRGAAEAFGADVVVRLTADCPLIDPGVIDRVVGALADRDYVANTYGKRTFPRGLDTEVFTAAALKQAAAEAGEPREREHVTPYIYNHPELFRLGGVENATDQSRFRWTVDTEEDFMLIRAILEKNAPANPMFSWENIVNFMDDNPELFEVNCHVRQKY